MADGKDCVCGAYGESECGCAADWTPQELIDARAEIARLRVTDAEREAIAGAIDVLEQEDQWHAVGEARINSLRGLLERTK